jgi:hypothetical protein
MATIPPFDQDGLLPPGDYEVSLDELRQSILVRVRPTRRIIKLGTGPGENGW